MTILITAKQHIHFSKATYAFGDMVVFSTQYKNMYRYV